MKYSIQNLMYKLSIILEVLVGIVVMIAIALSIAGLVVETFRMPTFGHDMLLPYLESTMEIIIGIEFVKLIFSHTIDAAVEVMLLAIVRMTIVGHPTALNILLSVVAVAVLFLTRKYLFVKKLDDTSLPTHGLFHDILPHKHDEKDDEADIPDDRH